jgi:glucan 1,3-beta-glucosidase
VVSAIGNVGLAVQGIIADPTSAPMEILGVLAGGGARSEKEFEDLAAARRNDISDADRAAIGSGFKSADDEFQELVTRACKV